MSGSLNEKDLLLNDLPGSLNEKDLLQKQPACEFPFLRSSEFLTGVNLGPIGPKNKTPRILQPGIIFFCTGYGSRLEHLAALVEIVLRVK
jgi:hypothetical protein